MPESMLVNSYRLKYKSKFVEVQTRSNEDNKMLDLRITSSSDRREAASFTKIATKISRMLYSGDRSRASINRKLNRMVNVDPDVLFFMRGVIDKLPLPE